MSKKISKKTEKIIKEMIESHAYENPLAIMAKEGARTMLKIALEEEIMEVLGRDHYERIDKDITGYRNGYKDRNIKLSVGDIRIKMPQVRGMEEPFHSKIIGPYQRSMEEIEQTIPLLYLNGIPTRKVKKSLKKIWGDKGLSHGTVKKGLQKIFYAAILEHAKEAVKQFEKKWKKVYPSAVECLLKDIDTCITYYRFPYSHWRRIRTTNVIERSFREVKQRVKTMERFRNENMALAAVWWLLKENQERWKPILMRDKEIAVLKIINNSNITEKVA